MASSPAGRRALLFPTSTLLYSFMFGCGMLEHGHVKLQRREHWNQAIDQAKVELEEQRKLIELNMQYLGADEKQQLLKDLDNHSDSAWMGDEAPPLAPSLARLPLCSKMIIRSAIDERMHHLGAEEKQRLLNALDENTDSINGGSDEAPPQGPDMASLPLCSKMIIEWTQNTAKTRELLEKSAGDHNVPQDAEAAADSQESDADKQKKWEKAAADRWTSEEERELWKESTMYTMLSRNKPRVPHNTGHQLDIENLPPQSIYASEDNKKRGLQSRWTRRKIQATNLAMAKLVLRLIKEGVRKEDKGVNCSITEKMKRLENIPAHFHQIFWPSLTQLGRLEFQITQQWYDTVWPHRSQQDDIPRFPPVFHNKYPYYQQDPAGEFHFDCYRMNHHIFNCFEQAFSSEISLDTLIMDICDCLMTSSAPPNTTTCNALILGFTRLEQPTLVEFVIQAFEESYARYDEITCCAILNHYMRTDRGNHFSNFINMMTGAVKVVDRRYLSLAHPLLHQSWSQEQLARKTHNRVVPHPTQPGKLVQKVFPTTKVFSRMIVGNLKFYGLEDTIKLCTQLTQDGWAFDITGLTYFLAATAAEADWAAGVMVWQQIQDLRAIAPARPFVAPNGSRTSPFDAAGRPTVFPSSSGQPLPPLDVETYAHMLVLCSKCERSDVAEHVLAEAYATSGHRPIPIQRLAQRLAKAGRDAMLMKSLRSDDHRLRTHVGQQLAADWHKWREEQADRMEDEAERRKEEEWLRAHVAKVRKHGVERWWDEEGNLDDGSAPPTTPTSTDAMATSQRQEHQPAPTPLTQNHHLDTGTTGTSASSDAVLADDEAAIKAWEAEAWMSTKSRRLYKHVRKAWSPQWVQDSSERSNGTNGDGNDSSSAKNGGGGGGGGRK